MFGFLLLRGKKYVICYKKHIVKKTIRSFKKVRYIKCTLYKMYVKLRFNLQRIRGKFIRGLEKRTLYQNVRYIKGT